jgi:glyoxylase-like metal-dependent hydrolase (beta-lactamase superfamily II)
MRARAERREFIQTLLAGAAGLTLTWPSSVQAQRGPAPITATKLTDRIAALSGAGGNVGVLSGPDGLLMIDGGTANRVTDLMKAVGEISPRMVQALFNTHYHFDHVGANETLGASHVRIIAHDNVKTRLSTTFENPAMGRTMEALAATGLPTETFAQRGMLTLGGERVEYTHTPPAHTDGDAFVFFANANVIQTGDLLWIGRYPVVDYTVGGSLLGMANALEQVEKVGDAQTRIICGHGPANVGKTEMRQVREMWLTINQRLEALAKQGRSVDEMLAAAPTADFDMQLGVRNPQAFLRQAYGGVLAQARR